MIRAALAILLLFLPVAAEAADRTIGIGSFERLRVEGPFRVRVTAGPPRATVSGDARTIDRIEVRVDGVTLVVRRGTGDWGEQPLATDAPVTVTLSTPALVAVSVIGNADVAVAGIKGQRADVSAMGSGTIALAAVDADSLAITVIGSAAVTASGHAAKARLLTNGSGTIKAGALATDDLVVRLDGAGETEAQARFTAEVVNTGLGRVTVAGNARCSIKASAGGPVTCGPRL